MIKTYTIDEAAELCKASNDTIYEAVHSFELKASKIGKAIVILEVDLIAYISAKSIANLKAKKCQSTYAAKRGGSMSLSTDSELDNLLAPATSAKRKKSTMKLSIVRNN